MSDCMIVGGQAYPSDVAARAVESAGGIVATFNSYNSDTAGPLVGKIARDILEEMRKSTAESDVE